MSNLYIYTGGTFDMLHSGHVELLNWLGDLCDNKVIVGLNTDEFVEEYKGRKPYRNYAERRDTVEGVRGVYRVYENFGGADSKPAIQHSINIHRRGNDQFVVAIGSDWAYPKDYLAQMGLTWDWLHAQHLPVVFIPRPSDGPSTTGTKNEMFQRMNEWENRPR